MTSKPAVLRFNSSIERRDGVLTFSLPAPVSQKVAVLDKLEGTIGGHPFRATPLRDDTGVYIRLNAAMQRRSAATVGDKIAVAILGPEPIPEPPTDLATAFSDSPEAAEVWDGLTVLGQRDWIRWIEDAKKPETRARRVTRTVSQLEDGKRRACCVDVNSFMMCRIKEDDDERRAKGPTA